MTWSRCDLDFNGFELGTVQTLRKSPCSLHVFSSCFLYAEPGAAKVQWRGIFSTFRWEGLNNCQKTWAFSLLMQMCDCQDMHTSKRQRASEQLKTYCFVLFCSRQTKCQPPQPWERVFAVNMRFAQSLSLRVRIWGSLPTSAADSLRGMGAVCSGQSFLVFSWLCTLPAVHDVPSGICSLSYVKP